MKLDGRYTKMKLDLEEVAKNLEAKKNENE